MFVPKADHYGRVIIWKNLLSGLEHLMKMYSLLFSVQQGRLRAHPGKGWCFAILRICSVWNTPPLPQPTNKGCTLHVSKPSSVFNHKPSFPKWLMSVSLLSQQWWLDDHFKCFFKPPASKSFRAIFWKQEHVTAFPSRHHLSWKRLSTEKKSPPSRVKWQRIFLMKQIHGS